MAAYIIVDCEVTDPAAYERYKALAPAAIAQYGGRYLVRGGKPELLEGGPPPNRVVLLEFPDLAAVRRFYDSPEYRAARNVRKGAADMRLIAVEGL